MDNANNWKAELDTFFQRREQQDRQQQLDHAQPSPGDAAKEEFMAIVATPAFDEFGAALILDADFQRLVDNALSALEADESLGDTLTQAAKELFPQE